MKGKIVHIEFGTGNYSGLKDFYTRLFSWEFDDKEDFGYALFKPGTKEHTGGVSVSDEPNTMGLLVYFEVDNLDQALNETKSMGAEVLIEKTEMGEKGFFSAIKDPFGNTIALWEWTKK